MGSLWSIDAALKHVANAMTLIFMFMREGTVFGGRGVSVIGASFSGVPAISCKANKKQ